MAKLLIELLLQTVGVVVLLLIASASAFLGCAVFDRLTIAMGVEFTVTNTAYVAAALVASTNPLVAIFGAVLVPVRFSPH